MNSKHLYVLLRKPDATGRIKKPTSKDFYCAAKIPLAEFDSTDPEEILRFLFSDSYTPAWARRHRRPLAVGDGFWLNGVAHLLTGVHDSGTFTHFTTIIDKINIQEVLSK